MRLRGLLVKATRRNKRVSSPCHKPNRWPMKTALKTTLVKEPLIIRRPQAQPPNNLNINILAKSRELSSLKDHNRSSHHRNPINKVEQARTSRTQVTAHLLRNHSRTDTANTQTN